MKELRSLDKRLLSLLLEHDSGCNTSYLAKVLNQSKQSINKRLNKLKNKEMIENVTHFWKIKEKGIVEVKNGLLKATQPSKRIFMGLKYKLKREMDRTTPVKLLEELKEMPFHAVGLNNTDQAIIKLKLTARLTSKSLTLYSKDFYYMRGNLSIIQESLLKTQLDAYARELEARLSLDLLEVKKDMLYSEVLQEEVADEHHPLAEATSKYQSKIVLARLPEDRHERLIADMSKGFKELETVHRSHAGEDSDMLDSQFNGVLDGKINLWHIPILMSEYAKTVETLGEYKKQIELHLNIMRKIDRKLSQKKLFD